MPERLPEPDYPPEAAVRKVRSNGEIKWRGDLIHISSALVGEAVAVEETEDGQWRVRFYDVPIGLIDTARRNCAASLPPFPPTRAARRRDEDKP